MTASKAALAMANRAHPDPHNVVCNDFNHQPCSCTRAYYVKLLAAAIDADPGVRAIVEAAGKLLVASGDALNSYDDAGVDAYGIDARDCRRLEQARDVLSAALRAWQPEEPQW